jgi:hypothetical protein
LFAANFFGAVLAHYEHLPMLDFCLIDSIFEGQKMLDLQKKYAIISNIFQVQHQARNIASRLE